MKHRWRPYRYKYTGSLLNSAVKWHRAWLVLGWGTALEALKVLAAFFFFLFFYFHLILFFLLFFTFPKLFCIFLTHLHCEQKRCLKFNVCRTILVWHLGCVNKFCVWSLGCVNESCVWKDFGEPKNEHLRWSSHHAYYLQVSPEALDVGHFKPHLSSLWGSPNDVVHFLASSTLCFKYFDLTQIK